MSVRVLVVDDSPTMRRLIIHALTQDGGIEVVGEAGDPHQARAAIKALSPDVITLDVEMPSMDGLSFLERLMRLRPMPVVMVSTLTEAGAPATIRALQLGAIDFVTKPTVGRPDGFADLPARVRTAARARLRQTRALSAPTPSADHAFEPDDTVIAIGASTGGVEALTAVLSRFPANCPPTIVTQHMPPLFMTTFAARLDRICAPSIVEAETGCPLRVGQVYLAPGGRHLELTSVGQPRCRLSDAPKVNGHRPSVDVMFASVARTLGPKAVGVILTGMGNDGAEGLSRMREAGAETIGQDEATSVVYGMPRAAFERGAVCRQLPIERIGERLVQITNAMTKAVP